MTRTISQAGILILGLAQALAGQTPANTRGFWIGLGFGAGQASMNCAACADAGGNGGSTFYTGVAWGVSHRLVLGAEANALISGPGVLAGIGYDARISSTLYLRPVLTVAVGFLGEVTEENQFLQRTVVGRGVTQHVVKLELGLMFHPRAQ